MEEFIQMFLSTQKVSGMIFDADGTILDSMPLWSHSGERYLKSLGIDAPPSLNDRLFAMTMHKGAEYMKKTYHLQQTAEEITAGINGPIMAAYEKEVPLKPGMRQFLDRLYAAHIPMAVVTSTDRPLIAAAFQRLGLNRYFKTVMTCSEFGSGKDRPEIFHAAVRILDSPPEETWVVEDGLYAMRTAKAAGCPVIGVYDEAAAKDEPEILKTADFYIRTAEQSYASGIPGADQIES